MKENAIAIIKRRSFIVSMLYSIIILTIGIFLVMDIMSSIVAIFTGYTPFEMLRPEEINDQLTELDLQICFGPYAEQDTESTSMYFRTITHYYYMILTGGESDLDYRYMSIQVPLSYTEQMNRIAEASAAGFSSEPLHLTGRIYRLNQKEYSLFQDSLLSSGWTMDEIEAMTLPYCIEVLSAAEERNRNTDYIFFFGMGLLLVFWSAWRILRSICGGNLRKFRRAYEAAGFTEAVVDADLAQAFPRVGKARVRVGLLCLYYGLTGQRPALIPNKDIIWAYHVHPLRDATAMRPDPPRRIAVYALKDKRPRMISVSDMASAQNILNRISKTMPWVIIGYTEELEKILREDRSRFLRLQYNTVAHVAQEPASDAGEGAIARIARYTGC